MENIFECVNICKTYERNEVLNNISLQVKRGDCLGILGDNGSGKSTLMSILAGTLQPKQGEILYNGQRLNKKSRSKIGYVPQQPILIEYISVNDNIRLWLDIYNIKELGNANIPTFLNIDSIMKKKVSTLSVGMKKRVSIAIALMNNPEFIILDEPFAALDATTVNSLIDYFKGNKDIGILFSSHNISEVIEICNKILVIKNGEIQYQ